MKKLMDTPEKSLRRIIDSPDPRVQEALARLRRDEGSPKDLEILISVFR